jgi:phosphoribosylanthranilate isomerase
MKVKVCGLNNAENIRELAALPIDMMGLIFYEKSPRCAGGLSAEALTAVPLSIEKVGVFVDEVPERILDKVEQYDLQAVQLHGHESPVLCSALKSQGIKVIKAFPVRDAEDITASASYEDTCDYFLFDTKTAQPGGSGEKFDWGILSCYQGNTPFFLSGGIDTDDASDIKKLCLPLLYAIDLNSRFEVAPGVKNINKIRDFLYNFYR